MSAQQHDQFLGGFADPATAQASFAQRLDVQQNPEQAMSSYQRVMHQHTKKQYEMATASSRRRSANPDSDMASLNSETSNASVSSTSS